MSELQRRGAATKTSTNGKQQATGQPPQPLDGEPNAPDLQFAKDNGATEEELIEAITHLAFYAGWPKAMSAMSVARQIFRSS